ncbi:2-hydroxychromene-2-carboxylate isomerase [Lysobacter sp. S4-A87]|uniref:2-hydroxychromene-2-carboxylate isomerase n=1 Tax=Lysobacter sp. S4-A87 TaxID=2925843 RepID=UPI001F539282|nr:2-hydroxychromene-2-carboxylate isomerase [Lysobacter sp. S4-A87]UNK48040.1 2-hydroxychromene-2-carboxylate isomerase [Lysobacter sp. S4-A87]
MSAAPLVWYFDFISPFSYLQWQKLKPLLREFEIDGTPVQLVPIVFAAVLDACGQKGPAEIPGKREFTYRHVLWLARQQGVPLRFPPTHPFNPLAALRLSIAAGNTPEAVDSIYDWLWAQGRAGDSLEALVPLMAVLNVPAEALDAAPTKAELRANTDAAIAAGVYGVPTLAVHGELFWGNDAHDFALAALREPAVLDDAEMQRVSQLPVGLQRRR